MIPGGNEYMVGQGTEDKQRNGLMNARGEVAGQDTDWTGYTDRDRGISRNGKKQQRGLARAVIG